MNTHTTTQKPKYNKGFIALFFTLGVASLLLTYVSISSHGVFDYMRQRLEFENLRNTVNTDIYCADAFADILVRTLATPPENTTDFAFEGVQCLATQVNLTRRSADTFTFSYIIGTLSISGTIEKGFITNIQSLRNSL